MVFPARVQPDFVGADAGQENILAAVPVEVGEGHAPPDGIIDPPTIADKGHLGFAAAESVNAVSTSVRPTKFMRSPPYSRSSGTRVNR
jgi:hypothetical protein